MPAPTRTDDEDHGLTGEANTLEDAPGEARVDRIIVEEMGALGEALNRNRRAQERRERAQRPGEGLRERKRRLTRQRISDVATTLFVARGFDNVRVADVAEIVGVSEKTVYNYFPTKESTVLDSEDESVERLARAVRERAPGESLSAVAIRALEADMEWFDLAPPELLRFLPRFADLLNSTPSLRSAWLDLQNRLVAVIREELAKRAEVDPSDPEPAIAARALVGLGEVSFESRVRHIERGLSGQDLRAAVSADIGRAARLLETGLWSFNAPAHGRQTREQVREAANAAEEARAEVVSALRQAHAAWKELRELR